MQSCAPTRHAEVRRSLFVYSPSVHHTADEGNRKTYKDGPHPITEQEGGGLDTCLRIILAVLASVNSVVDDRPTVRQGITGERNER